MSRYSRLRDGAPAELLLSDQLARYWLLTPSRRHTPPELLMGDPVTEEDCKVSTSLPSRPAIQFAFQIRVERQTDRFRGKEKDTIHKAQILENFDRVQSGQLFDNFLERLPPGASLKQRNNPGAPIHIDLTQAPGPAPFAPGGHHQQHAAAEDKVDDGGHGANLESAGLHGIGIEAHSVLVPGREGDIHVAPQAHLPCERVQAVPVLSRPHDGDQGHETAGDEQDGAVAQRVEGVGDEPNHPVRDPERDIQNQKPASQASERRDVIPGTRGVQCLFEPRFDEFGFHRREILRSLVRRALPDGRELHELGAALAQVEVHGPGTRERDQASVDPQFLHIFARGHHFVSIVRTDTDFESRPGCRRSQKE